MPNMKINQIGVVFPVAANYTIEWDRCRTQRAILEWVLQLSEKTWCTAEMIGEFVEAAAEHHGIEIYVGA